MNGCEAIRLELPGYAGGKLDVAAAGSVRAHLQACDACRVELRELERLEELLLKGLPSIVPSAGFASRFASRLAAEVQEEESPGESWLEWLFQPWLIPVGAVALIAMVMFQPWFADHSTSVFPTPGVTTGGLDGGGASARKPASDTQLAEARPPSRGVLGANPPRDLLRRPELFVDYSVIRDLDILEAGKGDVESHAG